MPVHQAHKMILWHVHEGVGSVQPYILAAQLFFRFRIIFVAAKMRQDEAGRGSFAKYVKDHIRGAKFLVRSVGIVARMGEDGKPQFRGGIYYAQIADIVKDHALVVGVNLNAAKALPGNGAKLLPAVRLIGMNAGKGQKPEPEPSLWFSLI